MKLIDFPMEWREPLIPMFSPTLEYRCLKCGAALPTDRLYYTCPQCGGLLMIEDTDEARILAKPGSFWRQLFDYRRMLNVPALAGIFRYQEFFAPLISQEDTVYLGEGWTPLVPAPDWFSDSLKADLYVKHDGQNPSASFKDRGMAAALSFLKYLIRTQGLKDMLAVCASTGDTSAAAALYAAALGPDLKSAVLLPRGKVTKPQLGQPLGAGAKVFELPGVFDDCMKVVERLSERYDVALLNSKNPWRVLGQETYAFEVAQQLWWELGDVSLFVPVGNAGNVTAIMGGLLKLLRYGLIDKLPRLIAVQSEHADPVYRYYSQPEGRREYKPVTVRPSVAQAAMIGDPVSFPRVQKFVADYDKAAGEQRFHVVEVTEQAIMDSMIAANRAGLTVCTQGGEGIAGLREALRRGIVEPWSKAVVDSTAHALKFAEFQGRYYEDGLREGFGIKAKKKLVNAPIEIEPQGVPLPVPGRAQNPAEREAYVAAAAADIAAALGLKAR